MYLRRSGWTDDDSFSVRTAAGEIRPRIEGELCTMDIGRVRLRAEADSRGRMTAPARPRTGASSRSSSCRWAIRRCRSRPGRARGARPPALRAGDRAHELFPNRTNVSFWRRTGDAEIRARIFERGVGETMSSGTGATGAAVAATLRGVDSPVTVVLDGGELVVDVGEDMHVE